MSDSIQLPDIGDSTGTLFTPEQEREFGEMFLRQVRSQATIDDDPEISDYIQTIGQKLAANSDNPRQSFNFFVVADPNINAFAGPGGQIGVNSGLILMADEESELAPCWRTKSPTSPSATFTSRWKPASG